MTALLALISVKDYVYIGVIAVLIGGGLWYHHKVLEEGVHSQIAADNAAAAKLKKQVDTKTAALQAQANTAEHAHDQEIADLTAYRDAHPVGVVQLCLAAHGSGSGLSAASAVAGKLKDSSPAAPSVQPVLAGNPSGGRGTSGPDISGLLTAFAAAADQVSAQLREFQAR